MSHSLAHKYRARKRLSKQQARERALKGWETRRRKNPALQNVERTGRKSFQWHRENGEVVPFHNVKAKHMEIISPALPILDKHLKEKEQLNTRVTAKPMRFHNYVQQPLSGRRIGAYVQTGVTEVDPSEVTKWDKLMGKYGGAHIHPDDWGKRNPMIINKQILEHPDRFYHPATVFAHEAGHLVGPGRATVWGPTATKPAEKTKSVEKFEKAFQWEAPRARKKGPLGDRPGYVELLRRGDPHGSLERALDEGMLNMGYQSGPRGVWKMRKEHPLSVDHEKKGYFKDVTKEWIPTYQSTDHSEDFAESFRYALGMPTFVGGKDFGDPFEPQTKAGGEGVFEVLDTKNKSRAKYMKDMHMKSVASHNQYLPTLRQNFETQKKAALEHKTSRSRARKAKMLGPFYREGGSHG